MEKLSTKNRAKLIDYLTERLSFERSGVQLYERIIEKMRGSRVQEFQAMLPQLEEYRDEERDHEQWLAGQIAALGGDARAESEMSRLVKEEWRGVEEVVLHDTQIPHLLHALLVAELMDNAGWEILMELADGAGDREAKRQFKKRYQEEEDHLSFARRAVERLAVQQVMGEQQPPQAAAS